MNDKVVDLIENTNVINEHSEDVHGVMKEFTYSSNFDDNGLLYYLGSLQKKHQYCNPAIQRFVSIQASSVATDSAVMTAVAGRKCERCMTDSRKPCWIIIDLKDVKIELNYYTLKHYNSYNNVLRTWTLEGSNDGKTWVILRVHQSDDSLSPLNDPGDTQSWSINPGYGYYSKFRLYMNGKNSSGRWYLACSGIELYGKAFGGMISDPEDKYKEIPLGLSALRETAAKEFEEKEKQLTDNDSYNNNVKPDKMYYHNSAGHYNTNNSKSKRKLRVSLSMNPMKGKFKMKVKRNKGNKSPDNDNEAKMDQDEFHIIDNDDNKDQEQDIVDTDNNFNPDSWRWNVYPRKYESCLSNKGKTIQRKENQDGFNEVYNANGNLVIGHTQFMFACSNGFNKGIIEFKIKYESVSHEYSQDAIGITSNVQDCISSDDKWVTWSNTKWDYPCNRYIYWGAGKIYCIAKDDNNVIQPKMCKYKWKSGEILTVRLDMSGDKWTILFLLDGDRKVYDAIEVEKDECYFPIISTQYDDTKYTII